ncbi:MAG: hypothetical protein B7Z08_07145 [Sphingomonadales bacterium 32-68-7]|nr:MAG: hypothetical protein B7Z33_04070 [Sphingomonadales bacterium 12-68-11]OYX09012.1 MAG: hypothetical protein B7Z08_07145 [Sphingomonadales bacterium 32-68-7]
MDLLCSRGTVWPPAMRALAGLSFAFPFVWFAAPAAATEEDTQFRLASGIAVTLSERFTAHVEPQHRWRAEGDLFELRTALDYAVNDWLTLTGAVVYTEQDPADDIRLQQQATLTFGPVAFRSRVEQRWYDRGDRPVIRLRQRVQFTQPITPRARAAISAELLYIARPQERGQRERVDQVRIEATLAQRLSDTFEAGIGYRGVFIPRAGQSDRISHTPQVTLNWRL